MVIHRMLTERQRPDREINVLPIPNQLSDMENVRGNIQGSLQAAAAPHMVPQHRAKIAFPLDTSMVNAWMSSLMTNNPTRSGYILAGTEYPWSDIKVSGSSSMMPINLNSF